MRVSARHFLTTIALPGLAIAILSFAAIPTVAHAQNGMLGVLNQRSGSTDSETNPNMVVKAKEMQYDQDKDTVTAIGSVQIYYNGRVLQADHVVYDRKSHRVQA